MIPRRDSMLSEPKTSTDLNRKSISAPTSRRVTSIASSAALLNDDWRDSYLPLDAAAETTANPKTKSIIQELPVQDFMALTDEDIAEVKIRAPSAPPARLPPPPPVLPPNTRNTRSPPYVPTKRASTGITRAPALAPDEVAAFQAARIAKKYDFDFLYVVNFWPSRTSQLHRPAGAPKRHSHAHSSSSASSATRSSTSSRPPSTLYSPTSDRAPTTKNSTPRNSLQADFPNEGGAADGSTDHQITDCCPGSAATSPRAGITGRLLTGYGLNTLEAPFRLSARAHRKILREGHDGWIEYRKADAGENEFARGYARSFYTGHDDASPAGRSSGPGLGDIDNNDKKQKNKSAKAPVVNRGIVFAAYRRPRGHGGTVHSGAAELEALEREAETLVELLLDFHQGRKRWESFQEAVMTE